MSAASMIAPSTATMLPAGAVAGQNPYADLTSTDFVKIMLSELSNQDPFKPNDSAALLEQMSSLRNIESSLSLQDSLESLVLQSSIGQAGSLIGKSVQGLDADGKDITGTVTSVRIVDGKAQLELDSGKTLPLDRVTSVSNPTPAPTPGIESTPGIIPGIVPAPGTTPLASTPAVMVPPSTRLPTGTPATTTQPVS